VQFEDYVDQRRAALLRFAAVLSGDPVLAEDLVAEVLATAFERWARIGVIENPHAYVRRMLVNEYLDTRDRSRRNDIAADLARLAAPVADHAQHIVEHAALAVELQRLPRKQRAAVVLRYYEGLSYAEIAETLGSGIVAARSNVFRALARLRVTFDAADEGDEDEDEDHQSMARAEHTS
jgi:RNA polymerase sigma factor (sigma-70 family)